tara:strand:+ start:601 stop:1161 length:561 start_codon:yes stop_codon:yes gene_type:complete
MKIHRVVTMLGATTTTGKLASDMYDLNYKTYYSEAEGRDVPISHMDFQHMVRAFVKLCDQENMLDRSKHMGTTKDLVAKIERLEELLKEKEELLDKEILQKDTWRNAYYDECSTRGSRYIFTEIPNNEYGKKLTRGMKVYLNDESYTMRVRGQHIKPELRGTGATYWGQSIEESTHLRVYIDKKRA